MSNRDSTSEEHTARVGQSMGCTDYCEECGGSIDTSSPNYYKTPDERFKHVVCYEEGGPGDYVLNLAEEYPFKRCVNRQYQCGHTAYGPVEDLPERCPHEDCGWFADSREDRYVGTEGEQ